MTQLSVPGIERALAEREFRRFVGHVQVLDFNSNRIVPFEYWPHLQEVEQALANHRFLLILKSRQLGFTWFFATYILWLAQFHGPANIPVISQGLKEAKDVIWRVRFIRKHLPAHLTVPEKGDAAEAMFLVNDSRIEAMPSTEGAGRSATGSLVLMDEADFHPYFDDNLNAILPIVEHGTAKLVVMSTRNPEMPRSAFTDLFRGAPANTWYPMFFPWMVRPGATQAWYDDAQKRAKNKLFFRIEHPASVADALLPIGGLSPFEPADLERLRQNIKTPIETRHGGTTHIWTRPIVGRRYCAFTDTAYGLGEDRDFGVTAIMDAQTKTIVADVCSNLLRPDVLIDHSVELLDDYWNPIWGIEDTGVGQVSVTKARALKYPRIYKHHKRNGDIGDYGWHPDSHSRDLLWNALITGVSSGEVTVYSDTAVSQLQDIVHNPKKDNRLEAAQGGHDDYPVAIGGCLLLCPYATVGKRAATSSAGAPTRFSWG